MNQNRWILLLVLVAAGCGVAYAATYNRMPPATFATASANCGTQTGNTCWVTDCNSTTNCTAGGGANAVAMIYNGSSWVHLADDAGTGVTSISATTADSFTFDSDGNATVLDAATNDNAVTITRADSGSVTFTCADDDTDALCIYDSGGAAGVQIGTANTTGINSIVAGDFDIENGATGSVVLAFHDYADTVVDDLDHAIFTVNCTDPTNEDCDLTIGVTENGAAAETRFTIDADGGIDFGSANTNDFTVTTDSTGDDEVVLPDSTIGPDEVGANMLIQAAFCGDLPSSTTNYASPITGYPNGVFYTGALTSVNLDYSLAGDGCAAEDSTTEATADEVMFADVAAKALGFYCQVSSSGSNGVEFHLRTAAGATTPDVTCTIATGENGCFAATPTTTDIAADATVAISATTTENLSAQDYWCMAQFALQD